MFQNIQKRGIASLSIRRIVIKENTPFTDQVVGKHLPTCRSSRRALVPAIRYCNFGLTICPQRIQGRRQATTILQQLAFELRSTLEGICRITKEFANLRKLVPVDRFQDFVVPTFTLAARGHLGFQLVREYSAPIDSIGVTNRLALIKPSIRERLDYALAFNAVQHNRFGSCICYVFNRWARHCEIEPKEYYLYITSNQRNFKRRSHGNTS